MSDGPASSIPASARAAATVREELGAQARLAPPLVLGFVGNQLMSLVDTAMVGRLGSAALAATGIGGSLYFACAVLGLGLVIGMDPLVAQAVGAGEPAKARRLLWQGTRVGLVASLPAMAALAGLTLALGLIGVEAETAGLTGRFLAGRALSMPLFLAFAAVRSYLQAIGRARSIVVATVVSNVVNLVGNAVLVFGDGSLAWLGLPGIGLPALGVFGSGLASTLAQGAGLFIVARAVAAHPTPHDPERRALDRDLVKKVVRLGLPISWQLVAEVGAFAVAAALAGRMGKVPAAAHQVALQLAAFTFQIALGISAATAVRVGHRVGQHDTPGARRAGFVGFALGLGVMSVGSLVFALSPGPLVRLLTDDAEVIAASLALVRIAAIFQLSDGAQVVGAGALRGAGDTESAKRWNVLGHYVVGIPLGVALGLGLGWGAPGLWWGLTAGLTVVGVSLTFRFHRLSRGTIGRA
jgi:MATE family multidrug resistance protein